MTVGGIQIDKKISFGQIIQIVLLLVTVVLAWGNLDNRVTSNEKATLEVKASSLERDAKQDASIADLTKGYNAMNIVLEGIRIDVGYLRRNVEDAKRTAVGD